MQNERFCKDCKYFEVGRDIDGPAIPWCQNLKTKQMPNPIGWLDTNAKACEHFEAAKNELPLLIPSTIVRVQDKPGKSLKVLFGLTHFGFWICILMTLSDGHYETVFRMLMVLSTLWVLYFAKEVSADLVRGRITFTR